MRLMHWPPHLHAVLVSRARVAPVRFHVSPTWRDPMRHLKLVTAVLLAVTAFALVGCSKKSNPVAPPAPTPM